VKKKTLHAILRYADESITASKEKGATPFQLQDVDNRNFI